MPVVRPALAQQQQPAPQTGGGLVDRGSGPVQIEADSGIEWRRDEKVYVATGNARAQRGAVTVFADRLMAYYDGATDNASDIIRVEAVGKVVIQTPGERAVGDKATYDVRNQVMVLTGADIRLTTKTQTVRARDSLEYWEQRKIAVARGKASAVEGDRRVEADTLTAHIIEDAKTRTSRIQKVDGFGNVRVSTPRETAIGSKGVYNLDSNIATLVGDVRVTQGRNQLNGEYAEVNLNTGVARMLSGAAAGRAGGPVRGLLVPQQGQAPQSGPQPRPAAPQ